MYLLQINVTNVNVIFLFVRKFIFIFLTARSSLCSISYHLFLFIITYLNQLNGNLNIYAGLDGMEEHIDTDKPKEKVKTPPSKRKSRATKLRFVFTRTIRFHIL